MKPLGRMVLQSVFIQMVRIHYGVYSMLDECEVDSLGSFLLRKPWLLFSIYHSEAPKFVILMPLTMCLLQTILQIVRTEKRPSLITIGGFGKIVVLATFERPYLDYDHPIPHLCLASFRAWIRTLLVAATFHFHSLGAPVFAVLILLSRMMETATFRLASTVLCETCHLP